MRFEQQKNRPSLSGSAKLAGILLLGILPACYSTHFPSATFPGLYSTTTGLQNLTREFGTSRPLFEDDKTIFYGKSTCAPDTSFVVKMDWAALKAVSGIVPIGMPGGILLAKDGRAIDEAEVPNIEWKRYQQRLAALGTDPGPTQPAATALPVPDYFTNAFYDYYPVVGISYEQAVAFCSWRGRVISKMVNYGKPGAPDSLAADHILVECRLPTEAEWQQAALAKRNQPHGTRCPEVAVEVNPKAAGYFKQRSGSPVFEPLIQADIRDYNRKRPTRSPISCDQPGPYFLRLVTPAYVYSGLPNDYQLFNLLGNVAEMVQERGIAKGGSYRDLLAACTATSRSAYAGPSPTLGFRCIIRATYPNRR